MVQLGYALSSEEHDPQALVKLAGRAEQAGYSFVSISDHFHPWTSQQGNSPFVWGVIGGIATATSRLELQTGVTCPIIRIHPAIIAQAAATAAALMPGSFRLGLGAGENLNEHIIGEHWPPPPVRHDMLCEAIEIIRELWAGEEVTYYGEYFTVEEAKLFTTPPSAPPALIAASGKKSAALAAENDGLITTAPDPKVIGAFEEAGGREKPRFGQITVCWAETEAEARKTAHKWWPTSGIPGNATWETKTVELFDQLATGVTEDQVAKSIICGPDPQKHISEIRKYIDAGFDHVYMHQVGPDQEGFFRFYEREVLPQISRQAGVSAAG
jgi:G6PDH family F420-dependent oxidoreductase